LRGVVDSTWTGAGQTPDGSPGRVLVTGEGERSRTFRGSAGGCPGAVQQAIRPITLKGFSLEPCPACPARFREGILGRGRGGPRQGCLASPVAGLQRLVSEQVVTYSGRPPEHRRTLGLVRLSRQVVDKSPFPKGARERNGPKGGMAGLPPTRRATCSLRGRDRAAAVVGIGLVPVARSGGGAGSLGTCSPCAAITEAGGVRPACDVAPGAPGRR